MSTHSSPPFACQKVPRFCTPLGSSCFQAGGGNPVPEIPLSPRYPRTPPRSQGTPPQPSALSGGRGQGSPGAWDTPDASRGLPPSLLGVRRARPRAGHHAGPKAPLCPRPPPAEPGPAAAVHRRRSVCLLYSTGTGRSVTHGNALRGHEEIQQVINDSK